MRGIDASNNQRRPRRSIQDLIRALGDGLDDLTTDELEFAPMTKVMGELELLGGKNAQRVSPIPDGAAEVLAAQFQSSPPLVPRHELVWQLRAAIERERAFVIRGCGGTGKSTLVRHLFPVAARGWKPFRRLFFLDCAGVRMPDPNGFERTALWSMFGSSEDIWRRVQGELKPSETNSPLIAFLERRGAGGLLVIDHAEHLDRSGGMDTWLTKRLLPLARERGLSVLFSVRTPRSERGLRSLRELPFMEVRNFARSELDDWIKEPFFVGKEGVGLSSQRILRLTGGTPRLVRDLAHYVAVTGRKDSTALRRFAQLRSHHFMPDCERFIWAARACPEILARGLSVLASGAQPQPDSDVTYNVTNALVASGVVRPRANGSLRFVSPIHERRIQILTRLENLPQIFSRTNLGQADSAKRLHRLRKVAELTTDGLSYSIMTEANPTEALRRVRELLHCWGLVGTISLRDPNNARLWISDAEHLGSASGPLDLSAQPDFASAVQTGRCVDGDDGRLFFPSTGPSGTVEFVAWGQLRGKHDLFKRQIAIERLVSLLRNLRPALMHAASQFWFQRQRRQEGRALYGPRPHWESALGCLPEAGPAAVAVLERSPRAWFISRCQTYDVRELPAPAAHALEPADVLRLDQIAYHPSGRGLVLGASDAHSIFPRLDKHETAVFLRPVWVGNRQACRIVVFLFRGTVVGRLDGHLQYRLSAIAPDLIAAAS